MITKNLSLGLIMSLHTNKGLKKTKITKQQCGRLGRLQRDCHCKKLPLNNTKSGSSCQLQALPIMDNDGDQLKGINVKRMDRTGSWRRCIFFSSDPLKNWIESGVQSADDMYPYGKRIVPNYIRCAEVANAAIEKMIAHNNNGSIKGVR